MGMRKSRKQSRPRVFGPLCDYVRTLPCVVCGNRPSQAHHVKTRGAGGQDFVNGVGNVAPLCLLCHNELHSIGRHTFEERHDLVNLAVVAANIGLDFSRGEE